MARARTFDSSAAPQPAHWLLARAGKRVLRPGGVELTGRLLRALAITPADRVVELAPGLGRTARTLARTPPASYIGVERHAAAIAYLRRKMPRLRFVEGSAEDTGLPGEIATVLFGEAMLTMQGAETKGRIVEEAWRLLRNGGRYGIHELCLCESGEPARGEIQEALARAVGDRIELLTAAEWAETLEAAGFQTACVLTAPMHLLRPSRMLADEGAARLAAIAFHLLRDGELRARISEMSKALRRYERHLEAVAIVAGKRYQS